MLLRFFAQCYWVALIHMDTSDSAGGDLEHAKSYYIPPGPEKWAHRFIQAFLWFPVCLHTRPLKGMCKQMWTSLAWSSTSPHPLESHFPHLMEVNHSERRVPGMEENNNMSHKLHSSFSSEQICIFDCSVLLKNVCQTPPKWVEKNTGIKSQHLEQVHNINTPHHSR